MMLKLFIIAGFLSVWAHQCSRQHDAQVSSPDIGKSAPIESDTVATMASVNFDADIKPIFVAHCQPCHFTGGKMYERMPFDQAKTILDHRDGIFRRIKDPEEVKKLTAFFESTGQ